MNTQDNIAHVEGSDIKSEEKTKGWISVKDKLPQNNEHVLCYNIYGRIMENSYSLHSDQDDGWFKRMFTHWMPLPEPPLND